MWRDVGIDFKKGIMPSPSENIEPGVINFTVFGNWTPLK